jgi:RNA polymerase sigma factor (sigma-70 family)
MPQESNVAAYAGLDQELVVRACRGDREAQEAVLGRCVVPLSRFANSLLPLYARGVTDTQDVVQDVLASAAARLEFISCDDEGALLSYLLRSVRHRVVDVIRRTTRRPQTIELLHDLPAGDVSPLDVAMRAQDQQRLREAMGRLNARDRLAVTLRLEHQSYAEIAERVGSPSANAARVMVRRAAARLARLLQSSARAQSRMRRYRA